VRQSGTIEEALMGRRFQLSSTAAKAAVPLAGIMCAIGLGPSSIEGAGPDEKPSTAGSRTEPRRIAVTFDDLPVTPPSLHPIDEQERITEALLSVLSRHDVPAVGFVNEQKLEADGQIDPRRVALLESWLDAGHELGNHTYSHVDLHDVPLDRFLDDVLRGERSTRRLLARRGEEPRYFRHPYLHTGRNLETKHAVEAFLARHGYRVAPVTVDNGEWIFGGAYARAGASGDAQLQRRLAAAYVPYMERVVRFYEDQSRQLFGREIPQVLLLHAYALNADHLDRLLNRLHGRGYRFIPLDEALADPAYASEDTYVGPGGITWLHRWAITRNVDRSMFAGEPDVPEWVRRALE
jgi:peptidoglycan/xylan/chitin deacetylase (PgdA/CDA1 family)